MAIHCSKCGHTLPGVKSLHLVSRCSNCGNTDRSLFIRVDDEDIDPKARERDKEWLEAHRADE